MKSNHCYVFEETRQDTQDGGTQSVFLARVQLHIAGAHPGNKTLYDYIMNYNTLPRRFVVHTSTTLKNKINVDKLEQSL